MEPCHKQDIKKLNSNKTHHKRCPTCGKPVRMKAYSQHEIYAIPGHNHRKKADCRPGRKTKLSHPACISSVQDHQIAKQGNESPNFFRIPSPETTPGIVSP